MPFLSGGLEVTFNELSEYSAPEQDLGRATPLSGLRAWLHYPPLGPQPSAKKQAAWLQILRYLMGQDNWFLYLCLWDGRAYPEISQD